MPWFKFTKEVSHVAGHVDYQYFPEDELPSDSTHRQEYVKNRCETWAENESGGHNRGYHYGFEEADPPEDYLMDLIKDTEDQAVGIIEDASFYRKELLRLYHSVPNIEDITKTSLSALLDTLQEVMPTHHYFTIFHSKGIKITICLKQVGKGAEGRTLKIYEGENIASVVQQGLLYYIEGDGKK